MTRRVASDETALAPLPRPGTLPAPLLWIVGALVGWLVGGAAFAELFMGASSRTVHSAPEAVVAVTAGTMYFGLVAVPFALLVCWPVLARLRGPLYARVAVLVLALGVVLWFAYRHQIEVFGALGVAALAVGSAVLYRLVVRSRAVVVCTLVAAASVLAYGLSVGLRFEVG